MLLNYNYRIFFSNFVAACVIIKQDSICFCYFDTQQQITFSYAFGYEN